MIGLVGVTLWGMLWLFLLALLAIGHDVNGFPWTVLVVGTVVTAGLMWYSHSTTQSRWVRKGD
jgi:hypothetical protein